MTRDEHQGLRERQSFKGKPYTQISSVLPNELLAEVQTYARRQNITRAAAISALLRKALGERGE